MHGVLLVVNCFQIKLTCPTVEEACSGVSIMVLATILSIFPLCLFIILKKYFEVRLIVSHSKGYPPSSSNVVMLLEDCFVRILFTEF